MAGLKFFDFRKQNSKRRKALRQATGGGNPEAIAGFLREYPDEAQRIADEAFTHIRGRAPWYSLLLCVGLAMVESTLAVDILRELVEEEFPGWKRLPPQHIQVLAAFLRETNAGDVLSQLEKRVGKDLGGSTFPDVKQESSPPFSTTPPDVLHGTRAASPLQDQAAGHSGPESFHSTPDHPDADETSDPDPAPKPISFQQRQIRVFVSSTFLDMIPERDHLMKFVFPKLRRLCEKRGVTFDMVDLRWGVTDEQAAEGKVLPICLEEIDRCRPYFIGFLGERYGWAPDSIPEELIRRAPWLGEQAKESRSVTEIEILYGALRHKSKEKRAFFYFRDPAYVEAAKKPKGFVTETIAKAMKLQNLKEQIRKSGFAVREDYPDPEALGELVLRDMSEVIENVYPEDSIPSLVELEAMEHEAFARSRSQVYIGRRQYFERLDEHADGSGKQPLVILGKSGSGKSALLANWAIRYREQHPEVVVIQHHIGATPYSAECSRMLQRIMAEWKHRVGVEEANLGNARTVFEQFASWLYQSASKGRVVLILDALNQLEDSEGASNLSWLPWNLPANVRLMVSTLEGKAFDEILGRSWPIFNVQPLQEEERSRLIRETLALRGKSLSFEQEQRITAAPPSANPLYLRVVLDELSLFGEHEALDERIAYYLEARSVNHLYEKVLVRWEEDFEGESDLVGDALSLLWASRRGLSEIELLEALGQNGEPLPRAIWSPLYLAMSNWLVNRNGLLTFVHDYLRAAVEESYVPNEENRRAVSSRLADYFQDRELSPRKVDELPWLLQRAGDRDRLRSCLLDIDNFLMMCEKDQYEILGYWIWLDQAREMGGLYLRAFEEWRESLSQKTVLDAAGALGAFLQKAGLYDEAEPLLREVLEAREKTLGPEHPSTLVGLNDLALLLMLKGDCAEAESLCRRALDGRERVLGAEHPDTLGSVNNLAALLYSKGDYAGAEQLYRRALDGQERVLGAEHPYTLMGVHNLALLLVLKGDYAGAEPLCRRALEGRERVLGPEHPETLASVSNLAALLYSKGDHAGAEPFFRRALEGSERVLGPEHPDTFKSLNNLAALLYSKGDYAGAEPFVRRALEGRERMLGAEHPETLMCMHNLAVLLKSKGDHAGAEPLYRRALEGRERVLGPKHPNTLMSLDSLADLLEKTGRSKEAQSLRSRFADFRG